MRILCDMRKQNAIYWPPADVDDFGHDTFGNLVEFIFTQSTGNFRVRWKDQIEEFLDATGTIRRSSAIVYLPLLPNGGEVEVGGFLWLGDRNDLTDEQVPQNNPAAFEVRRVDKVPTFGNDQQLRKAYL